MVQRRSSKGCRTQLAQLSLNATIFFSILLGAMPLKYSFKHRRLEQSRIAACYCLGCNLFIIIAVIAMARTQSGDIASEIFTKNSLTASISGAYGTFTLLLVVVTFYQNWRGRLRLLRIFGAIVQLDQQNFFPRRKSCVLFDYYAIWKGVFGVLKSLSSMYTTYGLGPPVFGVTYAVLIVLWLVLQNTLLLIWNQYYFGVLFIYKQFWVLNEQLKDKIKELNALSKRAVYSRRACEMAVEIDALMLLYVRLVRLCEELTALYSYQILMWLAFSMSSIVASAFYFCVILGGKIVEGSFYYWCLFPMLILVSILDLWLCITTYELTLTTANATHLLLRSFNDFRNLDVRLLRSLNDFAVLCTYERPRFCICGLFELHHRTGHQLLVTMAVYLMFLVQFDFMNL